MPDPNRVHAKNINKKNFNLLFLSNLVIAFFGIVFSVWKGLEAGTIYGFMFIGTIVLIVLVQLFLADDNTLKPITDYIRIPIAAKTTLALFFYSIGFGLPIIINLILHWTKSQYSIVNLSVPLFAGNLKPGVQSFATAEIQDSMAWKIFYRMFVAGNVETFTYNFGMVLMGVLLAVFILRLINEEKDLWFIPRRWFVLFIAFSISIAAFMLSHVMNGSYEGAAFVVAGIFLLVSNVSIYNAGVFLLFWAGWHQANNLIYLIQFFGLKIVLQGFISWFGLIYLFYWILIIFYLIRKWDVVGKDLADWGNY